MTRLFPHYSSFKALGLATLALASSSLFAENPYLGRWALTIPGGGAGWLGVEEKGETLKASILWGSGSVVPTKSATQQDGKLVVIREHSQKRKDADGKEIKEVVIETITASASGHDLELTTEKTLPDGSKKEKAAFKGKKLPAIPPTPDLTKVKYGEPMQLFNGKDLTGWKLINPKEDNGWRVQDGLLINRVQKDKHHGNLRTEKEFEDFNLKLELRTQAKSNSGIYLRGMYEIQVAETFGRPVDSHNMGALYSRITPSEAAEKPIGEWQTMDISFVDQHVTVVLNGKTIINNQPVLGCTGGALSSDGSKPGPLYLQGDHTNIDYRNIVLRPVVK